MNIKKVFIVMSIVAVLLAGTIVSVGAAAPMKVSSLKVSYAAGQIKATVGVADGLKKPVAGALVQVSFEKDGVPTILRSGRTNASGIATIFSPTSRGKWIVCVEEIHKLGYVYNAPVNVCTTIFVP